MIAVVDYGMGNLRSVQRALEHVGAPAALTTDPGIVGRAQKIVVPGVGAFRDAMKNLEATGLVRIIRDGIAAGKPFLGICLGLQMLFEESEEDGLHKGLGVLGGRVVRFSSALPDGGRLKVPHIGWNQLRLCGNCPLWRGIADGSHVYFDHSYYVAPADQSVVAGRTDYGVSFTSAIWWQNVYGTQFHPEKSQAVGLAILKNFAAL